MTMKLLCNKVQSILRKGISWFCTSPTSYNQLQNYRTSPLTPLFHSKVRVTHYRARRVVTSTFLCHVLLTILVRTTRMCGINTAVCLPHRYWVKPEFICVLSFNPIGVLQQLKFSKFLCSSFRFENFEYRYPELDTDLPP